MSVERSPVMDARMAGNPGRVTQVATGPGFSHVDVEFPLSFRDGDQTVTLEWDQTYWLARIKGSDDTSAIGTGDTQPEALACLIFALACEIGAYRPLADKYDAIARVVKEEPK